MKTEFCLQNRQMLFLSLRRLETFTNVSLWKILPSIIITQVLLKFHSVSYVFAQNCNCHWYAAHYSQPVIYFCLTCLSLNISWLMQWDEPFTLSVTGILLILYCRSSSPHSANAEHCQFEFLLCLLENTHSLSGSKLRCDFFLLLNVPSTPSLSLSPGRATAIN